MKSSEKKVKVEREEEKFLQDMWLYDCPGDECPGMRSGGCTGDICACDKLGDQIELVHANGHLVLNKLERNILLSLIMAYRDSKGPYKEYANGFIDKLGRLKYNY